VIEGFFKPGNEATLRELALRELDLGHEHAVGAPAAGARGRARAASGRVLVCISSLSPRAEALLRRGARLAGRLHTDWYVAYVETPEEAPGRIEAAAQRHLHANIEQARELGAAVVRLQGSDPVAALLGFARAHGVGQILIGRTSKPRWRRLLGGDFMARMLREADAFDLHIVAATSGDSEV
jgi:two-component system sensor histidine kinase KdpD